MRKFWILILLLSCVNRYLSAQSYHIGDVYTATDGSKGIVYYLFPDGSGGWVVALNDASTGCSWGENADITELTNHSTTNNHQQLFNDTAGYANTQTIRNYQNNNTTYAAGKVDFLQGWLLPSPAQLLKLYGELPFIVTSIIAAGGSDLAYDGYWCSAEYSSNKAWVVDFRDHYYNTHYYSGGIYSAAKTSVQRVRAVRSFTNTAVTYDTTLTYQWSTGSTQPYIDVSPSQTTTYTVTATTEFGCNNTAQLTILVGTGEPQTIYDKVCRGAGYEANGFTLTAEETDTTGTLSRTRTLTTSGCSSTLTLHLTVTPSVAELVEATSCGPYTWNGVTYYESGDYPQTFTAANGCDSVVTLHLTIQHPADTTLNVTVMENTLPYVLNDSAYTQEGTYTQHLLTAAGCDSTITLLLTVIPFTLPDNVDSADCVFFPEGTEWGIAVDWSSAEMVSPLVIPLVGDVDGDGIPEIICFAPNSSYNFYGVTDVKVYNSITHNVVHTVSLPDRVCTFDASPYGIIKLPNGHVIFVAAMMNYNLQAYDLTAQATTPMWTSIIPYQAPNIGFADFNGDAYPEIFIGNRIYDAETGTLLATGPEDGNQGLSYAHAGEHKLPSPCVADVAGDSKPDLILGNEIYDVTITNRNGMSGNGMTLLSSITPPAGVVMDGHPQVADFNLDGHLDVFISNKNSQSANVGCYVWDVHNNVVSTSLVIQANGQGKSIPLLADVDNDSLLEVVIQCNASSGNKVKCYKYNPFTSSFSTMWDIYVDEDSYSNSMTMFDFNNDGQGDLLMSDQSTVKIVNGSGRSHLTGNDTIPVYTLSSMSFGECTVMQYPVVADVDADGSAEIVICGRFGAGHTYQGYLNVFKSAGVPWAPARKVWNQYMYNVTNVNEDLTVPQYQFNNATAFIDPDGVVRRPYNNFLQQATTIDQYGRPFYAVPDVAISASVFSQMVGDSVALTFTYCNTGDNTLYAPFPVTVFSNNNSHDTICTAVIDIDLPVDSCAFGSIRFLATGLCDYVTLAVNCAGAGIAQNGGLQPECDTTNNVVTVPVTSFIDTTHLTVSACDSYIWYGDTLVQPGDYSKMLVKANGCDSVVTLQLSVKNSTSGTLDTAIIENSLPFTLNDSVYAEPGIYTQYLTNAAGCDSVLTVNLTVYPNVTAEVDSTICESELPFTWNDSVFTEAGTKTTIFPAHTGSDSTITMTLAILPTSYGTLDTAIIENALPLHYNDSVYAEPGIYTQYLMNAAGCDSVLTVNLTVYPNVTAEVDSTICESELPFTWNDSVFTEAGTKTTIFPAHTGSDSTITMTLAILPTSYGTLDTAIIENALPLHYNDSTYAETGTYTQYLTNTAGCDSIVTLHLTVYHNVTITIDTTVCASALPYPWHGHTFATAGSHTVTLQTAHGADSVVTYHLAVDDLSATAGSFTHVTCHGESTGAATVTVSGGLAPITYQWTNEAGTSVSTTTSLNNRPAGAYTFTATDHLGCTATVSVTLNTLNGALQAGAIAEDQIVCVGEDVPVFTGTAASGGDNGVYQWQISTDGVTWTPAPGTSNTQGYTYPNPATDGFTLRRAWISQSCGTAHSNTVAVAVWPNSSDTVTAAVCMGEPYQEHGFDITTAQTAIVGEYLFEQHYATGHCDSAIVLLLTVNPVFETELEDEVCEGGGYSENGFLVGQAETVGTEELTRTLSLQSVAGCDSVVTLHLTVIDTSLHVVPLTEDFCEEMVMELSAVSPMPDYVWNTGEEGLAITVTHAGFYSVTATQGGCSNTASFRIENCQNELYLPNAITTSLGDGLNDYFCIPEVNRRDMALFEIAIFNRWGEMVYYSTDKNFRWNGEYRGKIQYQTIYNYVIRYTDASGRPFRRTGSITVL